MPRECGRGFGEIVRKDMGAPPLSLSLSWDEVISASTQDDIMTDEAHKEIAVCSVCAS